MVGAGKARVQVTADVDLSRVDRAGREVRPGRPGGALDPDLGPQNANETRPNAAGAVVACPEHPGRPRRTRPRPAPTRPRARTDETTNYEISKTTRTEVQEPGPVKKLSVAVAVDGVTAPAGKDGKPGAYRPAHAPTRCSASKTWCARRSASTRPAATSVSGGQCPLRPAGDADGEGVEPPASPLSFDKNDIMRAGEMLGMLLVVAVLLILVRGPAADEEHGRRAGGGLRRWPAATAGGGRRAWSRRWTVQGDDAQALAAGRPERRWTQRIDIARIEGQVKASSVKQGRRVRREAPRRVRLDPP